MDIKKVNCVALLVSLIAKPKLEQLTPPTAKMVEQHQVVEVEFVLKEDKI